MDHKLMIRTKRILRIPVFTVIECWNLLLIPVFAVPIIEEFNMSYGIPYLWQVLEIHSVGDWWLVRNFAPVTDYKHLDQKGQVMRLVDTVWMHCPEKFVQKLLLHDNYLLLASLYPLLS